MKRTLSQIGMVVCVLIGTFVAYSVVNRQKNMNYQSNAKNMPQLLQQQRDPTKHDIQDVDFAKKMILVDQQAMQIADIGSKKSSDLTIRDMASKMYRAAQSDSQSYASWLSQWNERYFNLSDFPEMDGHDMYPTFTGMIPLSKVNSLDALTGSDFDKTFLDLMIEQHKGVISLQTDANSEGANVGYGEILKLRDKYAQNLNQHIVEMEQIMKSKR